MIFWSYPFLSLSNDSMHSVPRLLNIILNRGIVPGMDQRKQITTYSKTRLVRTRI